MSERWLKYHTLTDNIHNIYYRRPIIVLAISASMAYVSFATYKDERQYRGHGCNYACHTNALLYNRLIPIDLDTGTNMELIQNG